MMCLFMCVFNLLFPTEETHQIPSTDQLDPFSFPFHSLHSFGIQIICTKKKKKEHKNNRDVMHILYILEASSVPEVSGSFSL